ncbi:MAG: YihY/virulence factor BrkB family protein [Spirochaetes bacterium]|nr:YihY/virulence factor BrkB family protein [Spirochaetota bacterium]
MRNKQEKVKKSLKERIQSFVALFIGEQNMMDIDSFNGKIKKKIINTVRVFVSSANKFFTDDCFTHASAIAYTTLVSLIPTLTVALTFVAYIGSGKKDELFKDINVFLSDHNLQKLNIDPLLNAISQIVDNAASIGGVGAVFMIFSATAVLRTLDKALNAIWNVHKQRSLITQVIYYWAVLTLGPILLISGTTLATQISSAFTYPSYKAIYVKNSTDIWLVGDKSKIATNMGGTSFFDISSDSIDFDNQRLYKVNPVSGFLEESEEPVLSIDFDSNYYNDIEFQGSSGWIVGRNGIILETNDSGLSWHIISLGKINLNDIVMLDSNKGFIAADSGYIFKTEDSWKTITAVLTADFHHNINSISFYNQRGMAVCDNGFALSTDDAGKTWIPELILKSKIKKQTNLNKIYLSSNSSYIAGNQGTILYSDDSGKKWSDRSFKKYDYSSILVKNSSEIFISGEKGVLLYSDNSGSAWKKISTGTNKINSLLDNGGRIWAVGDLGSLVWSDDSGNTWKGTKGTSFIIFLLKFFGPFLFIWIFFLFAYKVIPNIYVPFKAAAIGASFTGAVWVAFIYLFIVYVKAFANSTFAIYGALAAIPLFLLIIYSSTLILLFGAQVSYTLMNPETYQNVRLLRRKDSHVKVFNGIKILVMIFGRFEGGEGDTSLKFLAKNTGNSLEEVNDLTDVFLKSKLIMLSEKSTFVPATSSKKVTISSIIDILFDANLNVPQNSLNTGLGKYLAGKFKALKVSRDSILGSETLESILKNR